MITNSTKHRHLSLATTAYSSSCIPSSPVLVEPNASSTMLLVPYDLDLGPNDPGFNIFDEHGLQDILNNLPDLDDSYFNVTKLETLMAYLLEPNCPFVPFLATSMLPLMLGG